MDGMWGLKRFGIDVVVACGATVMLLAVSYGWQAFP